MATRDGSDVDVVHVELNFQRDDLKQLIRVLGNKHPLVAELKRQLNLYVSEQSQGVSKFNSKESKLTYLANKLCGGSMESLFSKAVSLVNMGMQLEERGYEIMAVKRNFFKKEVIKFRIQGGN